MRHLIGFGHVNTNIQEIYLLCACGKIWHYSIRYLNIFLLYTLNEQVSLCLCENIIQN